MFGVASRKEKQKLPIIKVQMNVAGCMKIFFNGAELSRGRRVSLSQAGGNISFSWQSPSDAFLNALVVYRSGGDAPESDRKRAAPHERKTASPSQQKIDTARKYVYMIFNIENVNLSSGDAIVPYQSPQIPGNYTAVLYVQPFRGRIAGVQEHTQEEGEQLLVWAKKVCEIAFEIVADPELTGADRERPRSGPSQHIVRVGDRFTEFAENIPYDYEVIEVIGDGISSPIAEFRARTTNGHYIDDYRLQPSGKWHRLNETAVWDADIRWH